MNDFETVRQRKDGSLVDVSIASAPIRDRTGRVVGNMVAYTDTTERKTQAAEVHRLNAELRSRLDDLAASRARIVTAGDVERRRLERNLHDGAQQRLVALSLALRLMAERLVSDPDAVRVALAHAGDELSLALDELRELARGLHPAVLTEQGRRAAVEALALRATIAVEIVDIPHERLPEPIEAGAYYLISGGAHERDQVRGRLARACADRCPRGVRHRRDLGRWRRRREPRGRVRSPGARRRVEALGGSLDVVSPPGAGTSLRAEIPVANR